MDAPREPHASRRTSVLGTAAWCLGLALLALGPAALTGFTLRADMVFVPRQVLLPAWLGLGPALPRSVPQDAVVAVLSTVVPGVVLQPVVLVLTLALAGAGAAWLLRGERWVVQALAAVAYVWTPYVAERLLLGNWGLLVAYAALPWAVGLARDVRAGRRSWLVLVPVLALAALTPTGGLLVAAIAVPVAVVGGRAAMRSRALVVASAVLVNAPWIVPAVLAPTDLRPDADGALVFALRPEGGWGALLTALGTGGIWNSLAVPGSRSTLLAPAGTVALLLLASLGAAAARRVLGRAALLSLATASALGVAWCLLGAWGPTRPLVTWVATTVPGAGLLRDAQKLLMPWALLLAVAAALGAGRVAAGVARRVREPALAPGLVVATALALVLLVPDLLLGGAGRLAPTAYPAGWTSVREAVSDGPAGDVLLLPWSTYRAYPWNAGTPVLDPASRFLDRTTVADDALVVASADGLVTVSGEDPRSATVGAALRRGTVDAADLRAWGISLVLVETDQPGTPVRLPTGLVDVPLPPDAAAAGLRLLSTGGPAGPDPWAASALRTWAVLAVDLVTLVAVLASVAVLAVRTTPGRKLLHSRPLLTEE